MTRGLDEAERHRQQQDHARAVACAAAHRDWWWVAVYRANYSAFNGYHRTPSAYSQLRCEAPGCGRIWRTRAAYVDILPRTPPEQARRPVDV